MPDLRKPIRDAIVAGLKTDVPAVSNRVYDQRSNPLEPDDLDAILVYSGGAQPEQEIRVSGGRKLRWSYIVRVEIVIAATADVDATLDDLIAAVLASVLSDPTQGGAAYSTTVDEVPEPELRREGEHHYWGAFVDFLVTYFETL